MPIRDDRTPLDRHAPDVPHRHADHPRASDEFNRWRQARRSGRSGSTTGGNFGPAPDSGDTHTPSDNRAAKGNPEREPHLRP